MEFVAISAKRPVVPRAAFPNVGSVLRKCEVHGIDACRDSNYRDECPAAKYVTKEELDILGIDSLYVPELLKT